MHSAMVLSVAFGLRLYVTGKIFSDRRWFIPAKLHLYNNSIYFYSRELRHIGRNMFLLGQPYLCNKLFFFFTYLYIFIYILYTYILFIYYNIIYIYTMRLLMYTDTRLFY